MKLVSLTNDLTGATVIVNREMVVYFHPVNDARVMLHLRDKISIPVRGTLLQVAGALEA
jgi:hypothetical protein